jgi:hypothetical protein
MGGSTPACYGGSYLGSNPVISQKYKMGGISKEVANTPAKKYQKIRNIHHLPILLSSRNSTL